MSERPAKIGETCTIYDPKWGDIEYTVSAACDGKLGTWRCITHRQGFANYFERDGHVGNPHDDECVLAWVCVDHGPEVP